MRPLDSILRDYLISEVAGERFNSDGIDRHDRSEAIWEQITKAYNPGFADIERVIWNLDPEEFQLHELKPLKQKYLDLVWPVYAMELWKHEIGRQNKSKYAIWDLTSQISKQAMDFALQQNFVRFLSDSSVIPSPAPYLSIQTEGIVRDLCFISTGDIAVFFEDQKNKRYGVSLFDRQGDEREKCYLTSKRPHRHAIAHEAGINQCAGTIALVIEETLFSLDLTLKLLEDEPEDPFAVTSFSKSFADLQRQYNALNPAEFISHQNHSYGVFTRGLYPMTSVFVRGDGKSIEIPFDVSGAWPVKSQMPAIQEFPDGSCLLYSGNLFVSDPDFETYKEFPMTMCSNRGMYDVESDWTNSKFAIDKNSRLYIINQYRFYTDHPVSEAPKEEPKPSLKIMSTDPIEHITVVPLTGAGMIDYYMCVDVADDQRFAVAKFDTVDVYAPIDNMPLLS